MRRAQQLGYVGIAGFDMIVDACGAVWVIDLNFRLNGSTPALLWRPVLRERFGADCVMRYQHLELPGPVTTRLRMVRDMVRQRDFFPLAMFDPVAGGHSASCGKIEGMWFGASRQEAEAKRDALLAHGSGILRAA